MSEIKLKAIEAISALPEQVNWHDIIDALCLRLAINERIQELDDGIYIEDEDVERRLLGQ